MNKCIKLLKVMLNFSVCVNSKFNDIVDDCVCVWLYNGSHKHGFGDTSVIYPLRVD